MSALIAGKEPKVKQNRVFLDGYPNTFSFKMGFGTKAKVRLILTHVRNVRGLGHNNV